MAKTCETVSETPQWKEFNVALRRDVNDYFRALDTGTGANFIMWTKLIFGFSTYLILFVALLLHNGEWYSFVSLFALFGAGQAYVLVNIGHDAVHGAITRNQHVADLLRCSLDICGVDARLYSRAHNAFHHACINVDKMDDAIMARGLIRLSPHQNRPALGQLQHLYAWPLYALTSLDFLVKRDWEMLTYDKDAFGRLITSKLLYLTAVIGLPWWLTPHSLPTVIAGFLAAHCVIGFTVVVLFQLTHLVEGTRFYSSEEFTRIDRPHIFATTADVAPRSRLLNLCAGGLHQHIAHHFYPSVCHVHYQPITRIIQGRADEFNIPYRTHRRLRDALSAHAKLLWLLGRDEPVSNVPQSH